MRSRMHSLAFLASLAMAAAAVAPWASVYSLAALSSAAPPSARALALPPPRPTEEPPEAGGGWARVRALVAACRGEGLEGLQRCLLNATLVCLRDLLRRDAVQLMPGVELVRLRMRRAEGRGASEQDYDDYKTDEDYKDNKLEEIELEEEDDEDDDDIGGFAGFFSHVASMLQGHALRISSPPQRYDLVQGRRRHHYKHMFPMMVMSFMVMSAFLVPMGFQFMAVLGGKALLLSKMALLAASMLTYRKVAADLTHPVHHAHHAHHVPYHDPYFHSFHDRSAHAKLQ